MSHALASKSRSGCGCGGGSSAAGSGCSCGGGCGLCQGQDLARPRFFAGQLLTEDDLDLLANYVVEKNRLHNRSFFGEGVVCGLMITCDPCGGGKVTVQSGYALDCCGNDVVVPCPQTLDINALVKRLRIEKTGGVDCGDPCSEEKVKPKTESSDTTDSKDDEHEPPVLPAAEYCLYVRYCEQMTDPVSPYATDDPCGAQACEPTRVREGFRFELRCRTCDEPKPDNLFSRIQECLGNLITAEKTARDTRSLMHYGARLSPALHRLSAQQPAALLGPERLKSVEESLSIVKALPEAPEHWTASHAFDAVDAAERLASHVAASKTITSKERRSLGRFKPIADSVAAATDGLERLSRLATPERLTSLIDDELDREISVATTQRAFLWAKPADAVKKVPPEERELTAAGVILDRKIQSLVAASMARIKANLVDRLESRGTFTDCTLLRDVRAIVLPDDTPGRAGAILDSSASKRLRDALIRYVRECICAALNPPCPPCDDPAVLLACLRIEDCEVVDICNLERTFVLTPVALRYWMPFLRSIGDLLERACCPENRCDEPTKRRNLAEVTAAPPIAEYPRSYLYQRSAFNLANRTVGPSMTFDPARIAAILPSRLSFSPDNARRLAYSAAAVIDIVSLRHGAPVGDLIAPIFSPAVTTPTGVDKTRPPVSPAAPAPVPELGAIRADLDDLKKKLALSDKRNRDLASRLERLGG
jgi:hypothetical protein